VSTTPRKPFDDLDLMAYADGELDDETAAAVEAFLTEDDGAQSKRAALGQMNDVVRSYLELAADDAEPRLDAMWATIERRIQANGVAAAPAAVATRSLAQPVLAQPVSAAIATSSKSTESTGLWARISAWLDEYRGYFATGALAAAAAAVLVMALRPPQVVERIVVAPQPDSPRNPPQMVNVSTPPEVEVLEVNDGSASVFTLPKEDEGDVTAGVIWLDLDSSQTEGPL
jgi:anti-sigma factor RsiW